MSNASPYNEDEDEIQLLEKVRLSSPEEFEEKYRGIVYSYVRENILVWILEIENVAESCITEYADKLLDDFTTQIKNVTKEQYYEMLDTLLYADPIEDFIRELVGDKKEDLIRTANAISDKGQEITTIHEFEALLRNAMVAIYSEVEPLDAAREASGTLEETTSSTDAISSDPVDTDNTDRQAITAPGVSNTGPNRSSFICMPFYTLNKGQHIILDKADREMLCSAFQSRGLTFCPEDDVVVYARRCGNSAFVLPNSITAHVSGVYTARNLFGLTVRIPRKIGESLVRSTFNT